MASKTSGSTSKNTTKGQNPKYLGLKKSDGQVVRVGGIIIRQRGTKYRIGPNTFMGRDYTIHAGIDGYVKFFQKQNRTYVSVVTSR